MNVSSASKSLVLASASPYRRMLLKRLRFPFKCHAPGIDEMPLKGETPVALVRRLACAKAAAAGVVYADAIVIGSDQVAVCGRVLLNKPGNHQAARAQLQRLSGRRVRFHTGLCVRNGVTGSVRSAVISCKVQFRTLTRAEIERYLASEQPYDCAGSFKSEGLGISLLARMQSDDPTALIGLPLIKLCEMLRKEGLVVP